MKKSNLPVLVICLNPEQFEQLQEQSSILGISPSQLVEDIVKDYL